MKQVTYTLGKYHIGLLCTASKKTGLTKSDLLRRAIEQVYGNSKIPKDKHNASR